MNHSLGEIVPSNGTCPHVGSVSLVPEDRIMPPSSTKPQGSGSIQGYIKASQEQALCQNQDHLPPSAITKEKITASCTMSCHNVEVEKGDMGEREVEEMQIHLLAAKTSPDSPTKEPLQNLQQLCEDQACAFSSVSGGC